MYLTYPLFFCVSNNHNVQVGLFDSFNHSSCLPYSNSISKISHIPPVFFGVQKSKCPGWTVGHLDCWTLGLLNTFNRSSCLPHSNKRYLIYPLFFWCPTVKMSRLDCWTLGLLNTFNRSSCLPYSNKRYLISPCFFGVQQSKCPGWTVGHFDC